MLANDNPNLPKQWSEIIKPEKFTDSNPATVKLSGSNMDLRGTAATKPLATAVTIGATYWSVDTDPHGNAIEVSDGTNWVVM